MDLFGKEQYREVESKPLRPHQSAGVRDIRESLRRGNRRVVYQLPTGGGKTRVIAELCKLAVAKGSHVAVLAPRRELVYQIRDSLAGEGVRCGIIMAGELQGLYHRVHVCSFDTLHARAIQRDKIDLPRADLVLVDEGHLAVADSRRDILDRYDEARHVLFTATPARGDGRGLGEIADDMVLGPSISELVDMGFLLPLRYYAPSEPDLAAVKLNKDGDYQIKGLEKAVNKPTIIGDIVDNWVRIGEGRSTVVFCATRKHSRHVMQEFLRRGITAEHVDGETPLDEREQIFDRVANGVTTVLCNVFVASYGLDIPRLSCAVLARPTKNLTLYLQMIGRVMRPFYGQTDGLVIDHAGAVKENGFADDFIPWSLDGKEKIKDRIKAQKEAGAEAKEIRCPNCSYVFKRSHVCPKCGFQVVAPTEALPVHKAELQEVKRTKDESAAERRNRSTPSDVKRDEYAQMLRYAMDKGKAPGWASHTYRARYGVWPNAYRDTQPAARVGPEIAGFIRHRNMRYAKRRVA